MQTQAAIRSDAFRVVPTSRPFAPAPRPTGRPAFGGRAEANSLDESLQLMGATMSYPRNTEIFGENEPADYVYKVISGQRADLQHPERRSPPDRRLLHGRRYFRHRIRRRTHFGGRSDQRRKGAGHQAQRARRAGRPRCVGRPRAVRADRRASCGGCRIASCCSSRARKSASRDFFSRWRNAPAAAMPSICRCRARTSPTISA